MIDRVTQRFIKEGLLSVYRAYPKAIEYAVYYLPFEHSSFQEIGISIRSMHGIPEVPWPEENCIICTEDHISTLLGHDIKLFIMILHTKDFKVRMNLVPKSEDCGIVEPMEFFNVALSGRSRISIHRSQITLVHREGTYKCPMTDDYLQKKADQFPSATDEQKEKLKSYWKAMNSLSFDGIWVAKEMGLPNQDQMGLASDVLGYLANIVVPCHYFVKSSFEEGFGTRSQRRMTRGKPIFSVISYDRLYRTFLQTDDDYQEGVVEPHFRRGHVRHHWKKAGLNRQALPNSVIDRIKLVHKHRVERSYIPPTWIGENKFSIDGVSHEIMTKEMPLVRIGAN